MLFSYMQQTQRLIGDVTQKRVAPNDIIYYVNTARRHVAELTSSVRYLTPISGSITSLTVVHPGTSYVAPVLTISAPDLPSGTSSNPSGLQATATVTALVGGGISTVSITNPGSGYYAPVVTITDSAGSGGSITAITSSVTTLIQGQEVYNFSTFPITQTGIASIFAVRSVAIIYNQFRYVLPVYSFSTYQAFIRQYPLQYEYVPTVASQFGQGASGSLYFYPIPSQAYSFQADCICLPIDLAADSDTEVIPQPWQDAVPYFAAYLAKLEMQDMNGSRMMLDLFDKMLLRQSNSARIGRKVNPYGRW